MNPIENLLSFFQSRRKVFITTHVRPDADALGSSIALYHFLKEKGHDCKLVLPTSYAKIYNWFPLLEETFVFEKEDSLLNFNSSDYLAIGLPPQN